MKTILTSITLLIISMALGQTTIKKSSISSGGGSHNIGNTSLIYAIGEVAINDVSQSNTTIYEGFIGPDLMQSLGIVNYEQLQNVSVFPNPAQNKLQIQWKKTGNYELYFYDITGKLILQQSVSNKQEISFNITNWKTGVYMLVVIDRKHQKSINLKIQKL